MFSNYLKIAFRILVRHKGYSLLNIVGLAIGLTCTLLVAVYIRHELSYDQNTINADRMYRVLTRTERKNATTWTAGTPVPLGPALSAEFPLIEQVVRFWQSDPVVQYQRNIFQERGFYFADSGALAMFGWNLVKGDPATALRLPNSVILTSSTARKYFGAEDPLGKVLQYQGYPANKLALTVTGVMPDLPTNTQMDFDFLASVNGIRTEQTNWGSTKPIWTYILLPEGTAPTALESLLPAFADRHFKSQHTDYVKTLFLEPFLEVHFSTHVAEGFTTANSMTTIYVLGLIGLCILLVACVNYINLSTARSFSRAKEIGMRKVLGANRSVVARQFLSEALVLSFLATLLALVLEEIALPLFESLTATHLNARFFAEWDLLVMIVVIAGCTGLLAGIYPAIILSGFRPVWALKGRIDANRTGILARRSLVTVQFVVSIALISATFVIIDQMHYIRIKDLGITKEQVVVLPYTPQEQAFRSEVLRDPAVKSVTVSQRVPVNTDNDDTRTVRIPGVKEPIVAESYIADDEFLKTYGIHILAGRPFSLGFPEGDTPFLVNEAMMHRLGFRDPSEVLGTHFTWSGTYKDGTVVGVINDFHVTSLREAIAPMVILPIPDEEWWRTFISVRIEARDLRHTLAVLESTWRQLTPDGAYNYFFIDESLQKLHEQDLRVAETISVFAGLSVAVACLGLFALAAYSVERRTKEVGVRKVMGATVPNIVLLLSKEFALLVLLANCLAWPIAYVAVDSWLQSFAYRITIGAAPFALAGIAALLIAMLAVSYRSIRAALANPVDSLRYE